VAIALHDYSVLYSFPAAGVPVPLLCTLCALPVPPDMMSLPPRKHTGGMVHPPPWGVGVGRGGWHGVAHAWDSYIYLNLYTFIHIANSSNLHIGDD
jgi:hypothetical protein